MSSLFYIIFEIIGIICIFTFILSIIASIMRTYRNEAKKYFKVTIWLVIIVIIAYILSKLF